MIGADRCVRWVFGTWSLWNWIGALIEDWRDVVFELAMDGRLSHGQGSVDWRTVCGLALDCRIGNGLVD